MAQEKIKKITAYIDRFEELEDGTKDAVLLIGDEDDDIRKLVLPGDLLPEAAGEGENVTIEISLEG